MKRHTYQNGRCYRKPKGRSFHGDGQTVLEDCLESERSIVTGRPSMQEFLDIVGREMKIRAYQRGTIKTYLSCIRNLLRWLGRKPHFVNRESVRCFLETLVDGGIDSSSLAVYISAIRTVFDKLCGREVTKGLASPRRRKRLPVVPNRKEVMLLLKAAPSLRDKLLIGLMYATGVRVSEVCRLKWSDLDFTANQIRVSEGKGRVDRLVVLPKSFHGLLQHLCEFSEGPDSEDSSQFLFPGAEAGRYLSTRTVERVVSRVARIAGISKRITPHCLRHAFATHLLEHGTDIRFIQKMLGHARLETTTIYTRTAEMRGSPMVSPLDQVQAEVKAEGLTDVANVKTEIDAQPNTEVELNQRPHVGRMKVELKMIDDRMAEAMIHISASSTNISLDGIVVTKHEHGWVELQVPVFERWNKEILDLPVHVRSRLQEQEFFELVRKRVIAEFARLNQHSVV